MINHIIIYTLIFFAGLWNSVMDKLKDHFSTSIWWNEIKEKYNPQYTWMNKKFLGVMVLDLWHIAKTAMLGCIFIIRVIPAHLKWWEYFTLYGTWGLAFNLGYYVFFQRKNK